ncbi:unnamed protein product [Chironomus riparius]|uniref:Uncharacterized protein n=1 Tax=Chironomus riparius TaxID=315576 RepID=A0A9N9RLY6_9DIPT|nr:unnamed protein product [Chironomus riparius]
MGARKRIKSRLPNSLKSVEEKKRLANAQEKLRKIPNIEKTINDFCNFVDELAELPNTNALENPESDEESEIEENDEEMEEADENKEDSGDFTNSTIRGNGDGTST